MDIRSTANVPASASGLGLDQAGDVLPQAAPAPASAAEASYHKKATDAAIKFESFFIGHMLKQMRSSTKELAAEDSVYKNSINSDMLDMADNLVADQMAHQRAFGIADAILRQLLPAAPAAPSATQSATQSATSAATSAATSSAGQSALPTTATASASKKTPTGA